MEKRQKRKRTVIHAALYFWHTHHYAPSSKQAAKDETLFEGAINDVSSFYLRVNLLLFI
ncbi:hypothetical protein ACSFCM_18385 [Enterococcus gilvus]